MDALWDDQVSTNHISDFHRCRRGITLIGAEDMIIEGLCHIDLHHDPPSTQRRPYYSSSSTQRQCRSPSPASIRPSHRAYRPSLFMQAPRSPSPRCTGYRPTKRHMDAYFSRMKELIKGINVGLRMQFMLQV